MGTIIAQIITVGVSPLLTRIYLPEDYAALALFYAIASSLAPGISGRYDLAIVVTKNQQDSQILLGLAFWIAGILSILLFVILLFSYETLKGFLNAAQLGGWLLFTPVALFIAAYSTSLRYYANSQKNYSLLSRVSIIQASIVAILSLTLGLIGLGEAGLISASLCGAVLIFVYLIYCYRNTLKNINWHWNQEMRYLARRYKDYPLFNAPTSFLDGILLALPIFFLTKYFPEAVVGYYALLTRVASAPLSFIAGAISQVNLKKMAELIHSGTGGTAYLRKITLVMAAIVLLPTLFFMTMGPDLFAFVFGENWRVAGELLVILMPSLALRFVVSPLSGALLSTGHVRLGSAWQVIAFLVTLIVFVIVAPHATTKDFFYAILITDLFIYALYYVFIYYAASKPRVI